MIKLEALRPKSISHKILLAIFIMSSIITLVITLIELRIDYQREVSELKKNLTLVEESYAKSIATSMWELNTELLQTQLDGITSIPGLKHAAVYDNNSFMAKSGTIPENSIMKTIYLTHPNSQGKNIGLGTFIIYGDMHMVFEKISSKFLTIFMSQFLKILMISFMIYLCIQHIITKHLISIANYVKDLDLKSIHEKFELKRTKISSDDELDVLVESINLMRRKLYKSYTDLSKLNRELEEKVEAKTQIVLEQRKILEYSSRMSSLGEMASGIAHEINNPLMIIRTASSAMRRSVDSCGEQTEKLTKYCDKIESTTDRISKIIHGMLVLSRDSTDEDFSTFTLKENLEDVLDLCNEKFKSKGIELIVNLSDEVLYAPLLGRKVQFSQVFLNLLHNSFDAIENLEEKWIQIDGRIEDHRLILSFTDSGAGIPREIQEKIMNPFFTTKEVGRGTGLGLSLSMSIIKNHHGNFYFDDKAEHTKFVIDVPINDFMHDHTHPHQTH